MNKITVTVANSKNINDNFAVYLFNNNKYKKSFKHNKGLSFKAVESTKELEDTDSIVLGIFCNTVQVGLIAVTEDRVIELYYPFLFIIKVFDIKNGIDYPLVPYAIAPYEKWVAANQLFHVDYGNTLKIQLKPIRAYALANIDMIYPEYTRTVNEQLPSQEDERNLEAFWQIKEIQKRLKDESKQHDK